MLMKGKVNLIDRQTIAVEYFFTDNYRSKITKLDNVYFSDKTPKELLNEACITYASTFEGREQAVVQTFNFYKPPVITAPFDVGFFPTSAHKNVNCVWISAHPFQVFEVEKGKSRLQFYNSIDVYVDASVHTLNQQHQRLHTILNHFRNMHNATNNEPHQ